MVIFHQSSSGVSCMKEALIPESKQPGVSGMGRELSANIGRAWGQRGLRYVASDLPNSLRYL